MENFCGSEFWDWNLTWYTESPDFTPCFQSTALVWTPVGFLWLLALADVILSIQSRAKRIRWNFLNRAKLLLVSLLLLRESFFLLTVSIDNENMLPVQIFNPLIKVASYILVIALQILSLKRGIRSSGVQFSFWFLLTLCQMITFYSFVRNMGFSPEFKSLEGSLRSYLDLLNFPLILLQFLLHFWADSNKPSSRSLLIDPNRRPPCPKENYSFPNQIYFSWFAGLAWRGFKSPLQFQNVWRLLPGDEPAKLNATFEYYWKRDLLSLKNRVKGKKVGDSSPLLPPTKKEDVKVSIFPALWKTLWKLYTFSTIIRVIPDVLAFVNPKIVRMVIKYVHDGEEETWKGYFYAFLLFINASILCLFLNHSINGVILTGIRTRSILMGAIYRKALKLSRASKNNYTIGEIINFMSVDVEKIIDLFPYINITWVSPFQLAACIYFLWDILGMSVLAGVGVILVLVPINTLIVPKVRGLVLKQLKYKDERVRRLNEIITGMKVLKLYAWEPPFEEQVRRVRKEEVRTLRKIALLNAVSTMLDTCSPYFVTMATFTAFVLSDERNVLDAEKAFVSLTIFNMMFEPLSWFPVGVTRYFQTMVSFKRLDAFMNAEEIDPKAVSHDDSVAEAIRLEDATFAWDQTSTTLKNINLSIKPGSLVAIVGTVGSGKSSLLQAILGELNKIHGCVNTKGKIAYCAQQAWITNATLKDNILFGREYIHDSFRRVIDACALKPDLKILPGKELTEIGEKGINLSGGQKQRVALARAVYHNAEIYLLDDPLSAVDSYVGRHIFDRVIGPLGVLRGTTRVVATNNISFLPQFDTIIVLRDGYISEMGTYQELIDNDDQFSELITHFSSETSTPRSASPDLNENTQIVVPRRNSESFLNKSVTSIDEMDLEKDLPVSKLIEVEASETKSVKWRVYFDYFNNAGLLMVFGTIGFLTLHQVFAISGNISLSTWTSSTTQNRTVIQSQNQYFLSMYATFGILQAIAIFSASLLLNFGCLRSAASFHSKMLQRILHAPMSFFDTTPIGRIVNRFSKDVDTLDNFLPFNIKWLTNSSFKVGGTVFIICYSTPIILLGLIPIALVYFLLQKFYVATSRQLKRLESVSRSPIYSHFGETISGITSIRAFKDERRFILDSEKKMEQNQACWFCITIANRWLCMRLEVISFTLIFMATLFAVLGRDTLSPGLVGLSLSYSMVITFALKVVTRYACEVENTIVAVERIGEYLGVPQEAPWVNQVKGLSPSWPQRGNIEFRRYETRYRDGLDLALRNVTASIRDGEKVGIVGRTGAGKSSLTLALFRILEASSGAISIDGMNISELGLHQVRKKLTIIPQDPVLFSGTVRFNLDPFCAYTDSTLWRALELASLKDFIQTLPGGLLYQLSEEGENFSLGQRQLVCLARALLPETRILILDEATAAIDLQTEEIIRRTIRTEFKNSTIITIAHRLNNILDSDRIVVIDEGQVIEFDTPANLLSNSNSKFYSMAHAANLT